MKVLGEDAARRVVDGLLEGRGRRVGKLLHEGALAGCWQRRWRHRVLKHRDGVALQRVHRAAVRAEEGVNLLALHRDTVGAVDGARRLREQRQVLRPAAAADGAAAAMKEVDCDACGLSDGQQLLLRRVQLPQRRELASVLGGVRV